MNKEEFILELKKLNINVTKEQLEALEKYYQILIEYNKKTNLTRIIDKEDAYLKHFYDSLTLIKSVNLSSNQYVCDVGTGAGFPGIVLKIFYPNLNMVLLDSLNKRIEFLNYVIKELNLNDIVAIHERAEDYARKNREKFDLVVVRAVANLKILLELCIPLLKVGGLFVAMKGNLGEEYNESKEIIKKLSTKKDQIIEFDLPKENMHRTLLSFRKEKQTNSVYPRNFRMIKKSLKNN